MNGDDTQDCSTNSLLSKPKQIFDVEKPKRIDLENYKMHRQNLKKVESDHLFGDGSHIKKINDTKTRQLKKDR